MIATDKASFPEVAPTIEIFPGVDAELISDFDKYSNGKLFMGYTSCKLSSDGQQVGEMCTDITGRWFVVVGRATYEVPMKAIFDAFFDAHTRPETKAT